MFAFDDRTRALLDAVARRGSISAAARSLGLDPSNARRHLRTAETRAGRPLVVAARGGAARGSARLTRHAAARLGRGDALHGVALAFDPDEGTTSVRVGRRTLHAAGRVPEGPVALGLRPEDVLLARRAPDSSARNAVPGTVASLREADDGTWLVEVAAGALRLPARITRGARREMRLREGSRVVALLKATALRATPVR